MLGKARLNVIARYALRRRANGMSPPYLLGPQIYYGRPCASKIGEPSVFRFSNRPAAAAGDAGLPDMGPSNPGVSQGTIFLYVQVRFKSEADLALAAY